MLCKLAVHADCSCSTREISSFGGLFSTRAVAYTKPRELLSAMFMMALFSLSSIPRRILLYAMMSGGIFSGGSHILTVHSVATCIDNENSRFLVQPFFFEKFR